jgi:protoporphyrinogen oxidase
MRIAIMGAGFTGLSAGFELSKKNHDVYIFEKDTKPGGLAIGYKENEWKWSLEKHYHHWFTNDYSVLGLAKEINFPVVIQRPKTSVFVKEKIYQLDSPLSVIKFPLLSIFEKLVMSAILGFLKFFPFWKLLEKYNASKVLPKLMGKRAYQMIWEPLFINKFGRFYSDVSLAWFWARIKKRTPSLAYPTGGFLNFANALVKQIENKNGKFFFNTEIVEIKEKGKIFLKIKYPDGNIKTEIFDKLIVTSPSFIFLNVAPQLPEKYKKTLGKLKGLGATNLVLRLDKPFFKDGSYWLSVCDKNAPVMAIVEHTNFMNKKFYNNEHILYLGNYREHDDKYFYMDEKQMLSYFDSYLQKINKTYKDNIIGFKLFKAPFAQPIIPVNYSKILPKFDTPLKGVYLANIEQVYPWDRGTNYAVELGKKISQIILKDENS